MKIWIGLIVVIVVIFVFGRYLRYVNRPEKEPEINLEISSNGFQDGGKIPLRFTGYGEDISPQISIKGEVHPEGKSIVIIMDDIDHPAGCYNHWLIFDIPAEFKGVPEGIAKTSKVDELQGATQGKSSYGGKNYYRGPKPPFGTHKYVFKVYVLDKFLHLSKDTRKQEILKEMKSHILQYGKITGEYR